MALQLYESLSSPESQTTNINVDIMLACRSRGIKAEEIVAVSLSKGTKYVEAWLRVQCPKVLGRIGKEDLQHKKTRNMT